MNATAQKKIVANKVLVTGASGLLGVAAIEKFLSAGWEVVGVSRRKPELLSGRDVEFLSVDLRDEETARAAFEPLTDITHIAYTALHEKPELVAGWSSKEQIETNNAMLRNVVEPIVRTAANFQHISILQGTKIYGVHLHPIPIPARERDARKDHQNFFFDHEAYVREMGARHGFNYTALRPQLVTGPTPGALNVLPAIGVYAAIRREKGEPFGFPGGPSFVWEAADADLVGDVMVWAAQSPQAADEAFNITNGDVFEWRNVWPALAETLAGHANERGSLPRGKRGCLGPDSREVRSSLAEPAGAGWPRGPARGLRVRLRRPGRTSGLREHHQAAPGRVHKGD
jgi:nucleoside-diphosphate-sugar epimerase